jgi:hypothetical protein|tara:strand:+ start:445 stop:1131 length:687 start_codon:yes stop_codon:yes gene_type:complete
MSQLFVDNIKNRTGGAVGFPTGMVVTGVSTFESVSDINVAGIVTAQSGIEVVGFVTAQSGSAVTFSGGVDITNSVETVNTGSYATGADPISGITTGILTLNTKLGTVFTHDVDSNKAVGVVSITNFPVLKNSFHTVTLLINQDSAGTANTTAGNGIGTNVTLTPSGVSGFTTSALVGSATTVTLSTTAEDVDIITFGIHYNGSGTGTAANYKTFATKNGGFRYGTILS